MQLLVNATVTLPSSDPCFSYLQPIYERLLAVVEVQD